MMLSQRKVLVKGNYIQTPEAIEISDFIVKKSKKQGLYILESGTSIKSVDRFLFVELLVDGGEVTGTRYILPSDGEVKPKFYFRPEDSKEPEDIRCRILVLEGKVLK